MKRSTLIMIAVCFAVAACLLPRQSRAGVSVGIGVGVPGPVVAYPAPAYYPPAYYGPGVVAAAPGWGYYGYYGYYGPHHRWHYRRPYWRRHR